MPSLSQNFIFLPENTTYLDYPNFNPSLTYLTDKLKGKGYYYNSGIHTLQFSFYEFIGTILVEGTLVLEPTESDWSNISLSTNTYSVDTTGISILENIKSYTFNSSKNGSFFVNITGNYTYLRVRVNDFQQGRINQIKYNY